MEEQQTLISRVERSSPSGPAHQKQLSLSNSHRKGEGDFKIMPKATLIRLYLPTQIWHYGFLRRVYTRKWLLNKIKTMVSRGTNVLDFGCGDSPHRDLILANKGVYFGIDVKETKFGLVFDGLKAPFEDDSFDLVTLEEVLPLAPDSSILIKECKRVLKPGGSLIVTSNFSFR